MRLAISSAQCGANEKAAVVAALIAARTVSRAEPTQEARLPLMACETLRVRKE